MNNKSLLSFLLNESRTFPILIGALIIGLQLYGFATNNEMLVYGMMILPVIYLLMMSLTDDYNNWRKRND